MVALTLEAVDIVASVALREARLVAVAIDCSDPGFTTSTALSWGDNGVAHASIRQPTRTAEVQSVVPSRVQLSCSGQLCTTALTEAIGLPKGETLGGGAMEHITYTQKTAVSSVITSDCLTLSSVLKQLFSKCLHGHDVFSLFTLVEIRPPKLALASASESVTLVSDF